MLFFIGLMVSKRNRNGEDSLWFLYVNLFWNILSRIEERNVLYYNLCFVKYLVNKFLKEIGIDVVCGWEIVWKINIWLWSKVLRKNVKFEDNFLVKGWVRGELI